MTSEFILRNFSYIVCIPRLAENTFINSLVVALISPLKLFEFPLNASALRSAIGNHHPIYLTPF